MHKSGILFQHEDLILLTGKSGHLSNFCSHSDDLGTRILLLCSIDVGSKYYDFVYALCSFPVGDAFLLSLLG
jgi:hypothetical protein